MRGRAHLGAFALILVQAAWWASIALPGYFRLDDYLYLDTARHTGLWQWLGSIYWEHFAPGHRFAFWLVDAATPSRWLALQLVMVATFALGLFFFYRSLESLFGRSWWLLVPLAVTGFAWQFSLGFAWPSAGLQIIPEFGCGALCIYAFLRHLETGRWGWLAISVLAFTVGLAFYIRILLLFVVLATIRYVFLERSVGPRAVARGLWADRLRWAAFLLPTALYVRYYWQKHAFESPPPESFGQVGEYLRIAWLRNLMPGFLGVRMDASAPLMVWNVPAELGAWKTIAEVAGQVLVLGLLVLSFARKRAAALRAWAYVAILIAATFWLTARGKVGVAGAGAGYDPRYVSNLTWQLPIGVMFALHPRRVLELGAPWPSAIGRRTRPIAAVAVACTLIVTAVLATHSARSRERDWQGERVRTWVENVRDGFARADRTGPPTRVGEGESPDFVGGVSYSELLPLLGEDDRVGGAANAVVLPDGHVRRLR